MASTLAEPFELVTPGDLGDELAAFVRALRANNVSPNTILAYGGAVRQFGRWLLDNGHPTAIRQIEPRHVEEWIGCLLERNKPATAHNRWRGLQRFLNWYAEVDDDFRSPMAKLKPPRLPRLMPRVRRDNALIRVLFDSGARRHEIANLRYSPTNPEDSAFARLSASRLPALIAAIRECQELVDKLEGHVLDGEFEQWVPIQGYVQHDRPPRLKVRAAGGHAWAQLSASSGTYWLSSTRLGKEQLQHFLERFEAAATIAPNLVAQLQALSR